MHPNHDLDLVVFGYAISKYLLSLSKEEALRVLSVGYSREALEILYETAMDQEDYEVCEVIVQVLSRM